jgi:hypothetical protein
MNTTAGQQLINLSGIARMTGMQMPTVSNWRKRDDTFPKPAGGTDVRPLFSVAEIKDWIRATGKNVEFKERGLALQLADMLRSDYRSHEYPGILLSAIALTHWARQNRPDYLDSLMPERIEVLARDCASALTDRYRLVVDMIVQWANPYGRGRGSDAFIQLLRRVSQVEDLAELAQDVMALAVSRDSSMAEHLATPAFSDLLVSLLPPGGLTYSDLGSGGGQTLLTAARQNRSWKLHGIERDHSSNQFAACLLFVHNIDAQIDSADIFDRAVGMQFDRITFSAPFGMRLRDDQVWHISWPFGKPPLSRGDGAWPQLAYQALSHGGHAVVVVASGVLFRSGIERDIMGRMVAQGAIEAVISLPGNTQPNTALPVNILLLSKDKEHIPDKILMVDVSQIDSEEDRRDSRRERDFTEVFKKAINAVEAWRNGSDGTSEVSIAVPIADLMAPDATLMPQRWLASLTELSEEDVSSLIQGVGAAKDIWTRTMEEQTRPPSAASVKKSTNEVPLRPLPELGLVVIRGDYIRPKQEMEDPEDGTARVVTLESVRTGEPKELPAMTERLRKTPVRTQEGDILVTSLGSRVDARVCHEAGLEVDRNVNIVRGLGNAWDADFVAQQLMAKHNQAMLSGATIKRVDIKQLLIPQLPIEIQREAGRIFREFSVFSEASKQALDRAGTYINALREAISTGTVTVDAP